ncbi:expressed protein [Phakopsora pachyrhizi]|uniref:Expressed protein n=1 Tax=Phakopsora pachyrhizi TaxID=170000 RepID=A0AAV0AM18_PHAPC|nr:expressed protein [Phakopsora pachyrhizi]
MKKALRIYFGDNLDKTLLHTNEEISEIVSKFIGEEIESMDVEKVQVCSYDSKNPDGLDDLHMTPISELFSVLSFLKEQKTVNSDDDLEGVETKYLGYVKALGNLDEEDTPTRDLKLTIESEFVKRLSSHHGSDSTTAFENALEGTLKFGSSLKEREEGEEDKTLRKKDIKNPALKLSDLFIDREINTEELSSLGSATSIPMSAKFSEIFKSPCPTAKFRQLADIISEIFEVVGDKNTDKKYPGSPKCTEENDL